MMITVEKSFSTMELLMAKKTESRDPLVDFRVLGRPGESTEDRLHNLFLDKVIFWLLLVGAYFVVFVYDLIRLYLDSKPTPWFWLIVTLAVAAFAGYRMRKVWPEIRALKQGLRGERAIGELIEDLRKNGYQVFHDLDTGKQGNIDHALIGPAGVFALETKTISKPLSRKATIRFDGDRLLIDGRNPSDFGDRDPMDQVRTSATRLRDMIRSCSGKTVEVRPVLLYPGWMVDERFDLDVWVLNAKRLFTHLRGSERKLRDDDVAFFSENLRRYLSEAKE